VTIEQEFRRLNDGVRAAGSILTHYFGRQLNRTFKSTGSDFRTRADVEAENEILRTIERLFPEYNVFAEESGRVDRGSEFTFVIDPLDGTNNFVMGIPAFTSSVALLHGNEIVYAVIHHPVTGDTYWARKGGGAYRNDQPISVNAEDQRDRVTVGYTCEYTTPKERRYAFKSALLGLDIGRFLDLWSPAFCYCALADGRLEAMVTDGIPLYDFAAGRLIAAEAGAKTTDFDGGPFEDDGLDTFLISNGTAIHDYLVETITRPLSGNHLRRPGPSL
jgi:myo-inositol-1(or 4)-monophosphatase